MRATPRLSLVAALLTALAACAPVTDPDPSASAIPAQSVPESPTGADATHKLAGMIRTSVPMPRSVPGELLVKFKSKAGATAMLRKTSAVAVQTFKAVPGLNRVRLAATTSLDQALARLRASPDVEYAEPNYLYSLRAVPNDPRFAEQWSLDNTGQLNGWIAGNDIDAPEAWDFQANADGVVVAVIDSGVDYTHEDLAANVFQNTADCDADHVDDDADGFIDDCHGIDTANGDSDPMDDDGHGTHVAGIIGARGNNGVGIAGVAQHVTLLPCKFIDDTGEGSTAAAIACLDYVAAMKDRGVNIVATNNSWGGSADSQALRDAIRVQQQKGILFVTAAGNDRLNLDFYPDYPCVITQPNVICVTNHGGLGIQDNSTNYSDYLAHIGAPGQVILSTYPGNRYEALSGTSMAAPHVSGVLALLAAQSPSRTWLRNRNLLLASGRQYIGYEAVMRTVSQRLLNARAALDCHNLTLRSRTMPAYEFKQIHSTGEPITLGVLNIDCADPAGTVTATVSPGNTTVTLLDNGAGADELAGDGLYTANWTPATAGTYTLTFPGAVHGTLTVVVDDQLKHGFPVKQFFIRPTTVTPEFNYTLVGDFTGDAHPEILTSGYMMGPLFLFNYDGTRVPGWPRLDPSGFGLELLGVGAPVLAELDGDPAHKEIFSAYFSNVQGAYTADGQLMPGWPVVGRDDIEVTGPSLAVDLDGDGRDEVFAKVWGMYEVHRYDGALYPGWAPFSGTMPNVADMDGDGEPELINTSELGNNQPTTINVRHRDGTPLPGFPVTATDNISDSTVVGDIDGDGRNEILLMGRNTVTKVSDTGVITPLITITNEFTLSLVASLGDLDGDGIPEIIGQGEGTGVGSMNSYLYAWKGNGTLMSGFPVHLGDYQERRYSVPVIGDLDGDQQPDIAVFTHDAGNYVGEVHAFSRGGVELSGFPKQLSIEWGASPSIADLDLNGRNDLIIGGSNWGFADGLLDGLWAFEYRGVSATGPIEWGQYLEGPKRTGYYETGKNLATGAYLSTRVRGSGRVTATGIDCGTDCVQQYTKGTSVTLTATGSGGQTLVEWLGACAGKPNPCTLTVNRFTSTVARFSDGTGKHTLGVTMSGTGTGSVSSLPSGISCPGTCSADFFHNAQVTLTASAAPNSEFSGWTGACAAEVTRVCVVSLSAAANVGARFTAFVPLDVTVTGPGSVRSFSTSINCGSVCSELLAPGSVVQLDATEGPGAEFRGWGGACSGTNHSCILTVDAARSVTATFGRSYELSVSLAGSGTGSVSSDVPGITCGTDCSQNYDANSRVSLHATAAAGSRFSGWSGACTHALVDCVVDLSAAATVTATFIQRQTLTVTGSAAGSVTSDVAGINCGADCTEDYDAGISVTLTATASAGNMFTSWTGACSGSTATCTLVMSQARTVGVTFTPVAVTPPASPPSGGGGGGGRIDFAMLAMAALALATRLRMRRHN